MGKFYLRNANRLFLGTYVVWLHVCSFYYDMTNVGQALVNLDTNFVEIFFHEFLSVMLMAFLFTAAIHVPLRLWLIYRHKSDKSIIAPVLPNQKKAILEVEKQPIPGELLMNLSAN